MNPSFLSPPPFPGKKPHKWNATMAARIQYQTQPSNSVEEKQEEEEEEKKKRRQK